MFSRRLGVVCRFMLQTACDSSVPLCYIEDKTCGLITSVIAQITSVVYCIVLHSAESTLEWTGERWRAKY